ncbi:MAG TPA: hypothetical protein VHA52_10560, partial [Candidatus Babeliaceae bacterium]|nr:hypothetical protein [Candidatus Babeliaceae bacterium]
NFLLRIPAYKNDHEGLNEALKRVIYKLANNNMPEEGIERYNKIFDDLVNNGATVDVNSAGIQRVYSKAIQSNKLNLANKITNVARESLFKEVEQDPYSRFHILPPELLQNIIHYALLLPYSIKEYTKFKK